MPHDRHFLHAGLRRVALGAVAALGMVAIVGSGGGDPAPECSFSSNVCNPVINPPPATPAASIQPRKVTVQAGASVAFSARSEGIDQPAFQWQRSADGGVSFANIAAATAATYTLARVQFADDGAIFRVEVRDGSGNTVLASSNTGKLLVSSLPATTFADGEFDPADWSASAIAVPQGGPTHSEDRRATGGLPGTYRHMVHTMTTGPSSLRVFHSKGSAVYHPQALGAIHAIDYTEDCNRFSGTTTYNVLSYPTVEQAGRRYVSSLGRGCLLGWVGNFSQLPSLEAADYVQVDGPACGNGESCPDFSTGGAPLRFGFERRVSLLAQFPAGVVEHGIDNWKMTVWRR